MEFAHYSASSTPQTIATQSTSLIEQIEAADAECLPDRFKNYYFRDPLKPRDHYLHRVREIVSEPREGWSFVFGGTPNTHSAAIGIHENPWDEAHFDKKMAALQFLLAPEIEGTENCTRVLREAIAHLRNTGVEFVSARIGTEYLSAIHACEEVGFRYYETVIWAAVPTAGLAEVPGVRLMDRSEIERVAELAAASQFRGGHFYSDPKFETSVVDAMYSKWVRTHAERGNPIAVIDGTDGIAGFFAFALDPALEKHTGYSYGHLQLLALDPTARGMGLGRQLFQGTLTLIASMGADFIDTGYASRNHKSARLHTIANFYSVYDELTFHLWLSNEDGSKSRGQLQ